jgi:serine/threonine protein kinase/lipopolysaccharide biosynthesis regulator YciM
MTPERWQRLKELLEAALKLDGSRRADFLDRACQSDTELRAEIDGLLAAHAEATNVLPTDPASPSLDPTYPDGSVLAGRFRIDRFLGRGGMGEVYAAWDPVVQQNVAVKTLLPRIANDAESIGRLRQEIQSARRVTHPNVCRVFDLVRISQPGGDGFLLTMELIQGETLTSHLQRTGPLPLGEALALAKQISLGLDASHQAGVIHRDLKAANIILESSVGGRARAVVMDFGLARSSTGSNPSITKTGVIAGTPAYMPPEQLAGEAATAASDIYAFGVVLCELVTGQRPRAGGELPQEPAMNRRWARVIRRCIERSPEKRFRTAGEAVSGLTRQLVVSKKAWRALAGGVLALGLAALGLWGYRWRQGTTQPAGSAVLLQDVVNSTHFPELDGATEVFRSQLRQSAYLNLWNRSRLPDVLKKMEKPGNTPLTPELARDVAYREGVPIVLSAGIAPLGDQLTLSVLLEILEPGSPAARRRLSKSFTASGKQELFGAIDEACTWIRGTVGERQDEINQNDRPPEDVTTSSWQAQASYFRAEKLQAERNSDEAVQILKDAVTFDPHFALGLMRLADILTANQGQDEGFRYWSLAIAEANRNHLSRYEELRLRGLYAGDTWDWAGYESAFAQMEKEFPHEYLASFYLGDALALRGNFEASIRAFERAASKTKDSIPIADNLGAVYAESGDFEKARSTEAELRRLAAPEKAVLKEGELLMSKADFSGALIQFRSLHSSSDQFLRGRAQWFEASQLAEEGRAAEAEAVLREGAQEDNSAALADQQAEKLGGLAYLLQKRGALREARSAVREAAARVRSAYYMVPIAVMAARVGEKSVALDLVKRVEAAAPGTKLADISRLLTEGEIALAEGRAEDAVTLLKRADGMESALTPRDALAHALEKAGQVQEALTDYLRSAEIRRYVFAHPGQNYPGMFTDLLSDIVRCAKVAGREDVAREAETELRNRRPSGADHRK